ncbi:cytochrome P450 [Streptomyces spiramenti]|uniref:Cytochrome P450 n=1 Tax=Streptomyces spiramenti TaxID=2720606 RepID=A0ABX1APX7_9ACTN|nr:cytochrome P450 [Streptomyces spiramenti]NJP66738.1 cytochrome P450 [Streptomyces spiramenti]
MNQTRPYPFDMTRTDVSGLYSTLREKEPISRVQLPYGEPAWLAVRHDDVKTVLSDPRFSRELAQGLDQPRLRSENIDDGIMGMDPPDHTRLRRLVGKAFTARRVERMREGVQHRADALVDAMTTKGSADLVEEFARPLPVSVICELLGVPFEDHVIFRRWTESVTNEESAISNVLARIGPEMNAYMGELVEQRRREPTDDLLGALVRARDEGDRLTEDELIAISGPGLLAGGAETVSSGIPSFVYTLLTQPELLAQLKGQPELIPRAVEELLRYVPINTSAMFARYSLEDVELSGVTVRAGEPVLPAIHAANRDPEVFADPERIDLTREKNPHVTFGHGPHHCIGAQLARLELQVAMKTLLERLPGLRLAEGEAGVEWTFGVIVRGPSRLPVTW